MSKKASIEIIIVVAVVIAGISLYWFVQKQRRKYTGLVEKVTMGISSTSLLPCLVHIAKEKDYFLGEGVDVEIKDYPAGKFALAATLKGELDMVSNNGRPSKMGN